MKLSYRPFVQAIPFVRVIQWAFALAAFSAIASAQNPLTITTSTLPPGTSGQPYTQQLSATGGQLPYTWSITSGAADGLILNAASGNLAGTPQASGTFSFRVQVKDNTGATAAVSLSLVVNAPAPLTITTSRQLADAVLNAPYTQQMSATGGQPPYRWSANGLPAGLVMNSSTGLISGTPTAAGPFGVAITVSDSALTNSQDRFTMNVGLPAPPPVTFSGLPATASPSQQYTLQVSLGAAYPAPISGQAILSFSPDTGPTDRTIQFSTGGTTAAFNIAAGSTVPDSALALQTGTVSGTLTVTLRLQAGGIDITPSPAPVLSAQIPRAAPVIRSVQVNRSGSTLNIVVTGYSTAREVTQAVFSFSAASGQTLQPAASSITVDVNSLFGNWFLDPANSQFGSIFVFTQPFTVQGDVNAVIPISVVLTNRIGSTTAQVTP